MTLVSHDHRFVFLKTRKTAGTSVEMYLQPFCTPPGTPVTEWGEAIVSDHGIVGQRLDKARRAEPPAPDVVRDEWFAHQPARGIKRKLPPEQWDSYEKITAVRNPFHKVLSGFFWRKRDAALPEDPAARVEMFRDTVRKGHISDDADIVFIEEEGTAPQFLPDTIIRAEALAPDLEALTERLGLDTSRTELPLTKSSGRAPGVLPLTEWYDEATANIVRDRLDWMFSAGGYSREVPE